MTHSVSFQLNHITCASCVQKIEKKLSSMPGIQKCSVNFAAESVNIEYDSQKSSEKEIIKALKDLGYPVKDSKKPSKELFWLKARTWFSCILSVPLVLPMILQLFGHPFELNGFYQFLLATPVQFLGGFPFYVGTYKSLKAKSTNMDVLVALGTTTAYAYSLAMLLGWHGQGYYFETSAVLISLILLGRVLEKTSKMNAESEMRALLQMQPKEVRVKRSEEFVTIPIEELQIGDIFLVRPGEKVPADGEVISGTSHIDESMLSGESAPINKTIGAKIFAATINSEGALEAKALKLGKETSLGHIIELVQKAQQTKPQVQRIADKVSAVFVPIVLGISLITFLLWWLLAHDFTKAVINAVSTLVIACPCALGLATPIVVMVAISKAAKMGILIKDAQSLEKAKQTKVVLFDKTGTITKGKLSVEEEEGKEEHFWKMAASLASLSTHPICAGILEYTQKKNISPEKVEDFFSTPGKGITGKVQGVLYRLGSYPFLEENGISIEQKSAEKSMAALSQDQKYLGTIYLSDPIKKSSKEAVLAIQNLKIETVLLSGDRQKIVEQVSKEVGIARFFAEVKPEDKVGFVEKLQKEGKIVAMVGDGVNDAPALAKADVSFAIGEGTDVAMESASIGLIQNDMMNVFKTFRLSELSSKKIFQNLFFAFFYNCLGIPLAALGYLNPMIAGAAMALSSISVVINAIFLKKTQI